MTRAISIAAHTGSVWPWLAQLGRGAGWYSIDWPDNGRRRSARHLVSRIPELRLGDASAFGSVRHVERGRSLAWWADGAPFRRAATCLSENMRLRAQAGGPGLLRPRRTEAWCASRQPG